MLVPFYFLVGQWGTGDRVAATFKLVVYTLVGSLLMLAAAVATGITAGVGRRRRDELLDRGARRRAGRRGPAALDLRRVRARVPDQDAGVPVPRLDARRLSQHAAAGAGGVLRRALEGRRLRLPARRAADLPGRRGGLPDADPAARARVDPVRLRAGVHADQRAPDPRLLVGRAARLHHARHLRARAGRRRAGRAAADGQPRARRGAAVLHHRAAGRADGLARTSARWAASRSVRRCSRRCS